MDTFKFKIGITIYLLGVMLLMSCIHYCNTGETDSMYEELAENIIEEVSGINLDLSPE